MKKYLTAAAFMALSSASAFAADLPARTYTKAPPIVAPMYDWSGFYIGLNGGGGSSHKCWDLVGLPGLGAFSPISEGCHNATGGTVGGQIGYRWQASNWVFGLEAQGNWANFSGSNVNILLLDKSKIDAFGLFTGQVGYAWNNALLYVKGGAAVTSDKYNTTFIATGLINSSFSETRWGGVIGAGIEFGFAPNWSVGVEYDHMFMGTRDAAFNTPAGVYSSTSRISQDADLGTVRVNYRWGGPVVAKY